MRHGMKPEDNKDLQNAAIRHRYVIQIKRPPGWISVHGEDSARSARAFLRNGSSQDVLFDMEGGRAARILDTQTGQILMRVSRLRFLAVGVVQFALFTGALLALAMILKDADLPFF